MGYGGSSLRLPLFKNKYIRCCNPSNTWSDRQSSPYVTSADVTRFRHSSMSSYVPAWSGLWKTICILLYTFASRLRLIGSGWVDIGMRQWRLRVWTCAIPDFSCTEPHGFEAHCDNIRSLELLKRRSLLNDKSIFGCYISGSDQARDYQGENSLLPYRSFAAYMRG